MQITFDEERVKEVVTKVLIDKSESMTSKRKKLLSIGKQAGKELEKLFFGGSQKQENEADHQIQGSEWLSTYLKMKKVVDLLGYSETLDCEQLFVEFLFK